MEQACRNDRRGGKTAEVPKENERKDLVVRMHEELQHRGADKETIKNVIKRCETCQINNRKSKTSGNRLLHAGPGRRGAGEQGDKGRSKDSAREELVTDNGKEFCSREFSRMCHGKGTRHTKVGVESHRSNG